MTDPFERWNVDPAGVAARWVVTGATGLLHVGRAGAQTLTVLGDPRSAAPLVDDVVAELGPRVERLTVAQGTLPLLGEEVARHLGVGADWDWLWTSQVPAPQPAEHLVAAVDRPEAVADLLHRASPRPSARPGDGGVGAWLGVLDPADRLVACGAHTEHVPGVPHLASIAVDPAHRGGGLGGAVTAALTRRALVAGADVVTLGMYADNGPARRLYARLGYRREHRFSSRALVW